MEPDVLFSHPHNLTSIFERSIFVSTYHLFRGFTRGLFSFSDQNLAWISQLSLICIVHPFSV